MSSVDTRHPRYDANSPRWRKMRDCYEGEEVIKDKREVYLPALQSHREDGFPKLETEGWFNYQSYLVRAVFPDIVREAVEGLLGVMHAKPPQIEVPSRLEPMLKRATLKGETPEMLLRRINEEQLIQGRVGLLADTVGRDPTPYLSLYRAEHIINWDEGQRSTSRLDALNLVVLDETDDERSETFTWQRVEAYRVLVLGDPLALERTGLYQFGVFKDEVLAPQLLDGREPDGVQRGFDFNAGALVTPDFQGRTLDQIPFVFCNTRDIVAEPDRPPLLGLANIALQIYRGEADLRQTLHLIGQDTLVIIGAQEEEDEGQQRTGAGSIIWIPNPEGDAKYVGIDSSGVSEQRATLEGDYTRADKSSGRLLDTTGGPAESGEALRIRVAARTSTLHQIALTGAEALKDILKICARWVGANPEEVIVTPNQDFVNDEVVVTELVGLQTFKNQGGRISRLTIHEYMQAKNLTQRTQEEEEDQIALEEATAPTEPGTSNPEGPEEEPEIIEEPVGATAG